MMEKIKSFRGVYMRDDLPGTIHKHESGIVNLDDASGPGTHWVCYYNDPNSEYVEYFDSFGLPPPKEIDKYLRTSGKKIRMSTSQIQALYSAACGYYCCYYIIERENGKSQYDVVYSLDQMPSEDNEELMEDYFAGVVEKITEKDREDERLKKGGRLLEIVVEKLAEPTPRDILDLCDKVRNSNRGWMEKGYAKMLRKIVRSKYNG